MKNLVRKKNFQKKAGSAFLPKKCKVTDLDNGFPVRTRRNSKHSKDILPAGSDVSLIRIDQLRHTAQNQILNDLQSSSANDT